MRRGGEDDAGEEEGEQAEEAAEEPEEPQKKVFRMARTSVQDSSYFIFEPKPPAVGMASTFQARSAALGRGS